MRGRWGVVLERELTGGGLAVWYLRYLIEIVMQNTLLHPPGLALFPIGYGAPSDLRPRTVPPRAPYK